MKVQIENLSPVQKKLQVSIPEDEVLAEIEKAYTRVGKQANIPGFRQGKAPRTLLEKRFGPAIESEVYQELVRKSMFDALTEHELQAVAVPEIKEPKREKGEGFSFTASVEVKPSFEPKDYLGVSVKQEEVKVKEDQIQGVYKRLQDSHAVLKEREGATKAVKGDFVSLLIQGIDENGELLNAKDEPKEQLYEIGGEILHAEVEKVVLKLSLGEAAPVTIATKSAKGTEEPKPREIHVRVTLKAIKEKIMPALNDDFAKSVGPFENLAALRERIEKDLLEELTEKSKSDTLQKVLEVVLKKNDIPLPETLVHQELHALMHGFWDQLRQAGMKQVPEEYSEEKLHEKMKPDAERRVREQLILEAIAKKENITVPESEVTSRLQEFAKSANVPYAEFRAYYEKTDRLDALRFQMLAQKTLDFLLSKANIKK